MMSRLLVLMNLWVMCAFGISCTHAQGSPLLGKFSATQHQGQVNLYWQILQGNSCNGIQIYRSSDSLQFERIGYIPGICGSDFEDTNFYFTDSFPNHSTVNYYYLELGTVGVSETISLLVFSSNDSYRVQPNPAQDQTTIYFNHIDVGEYALRVYDVRGALVEQSLTTNDYFDLDVSGWPAGSYMFTVSLEKDAPFIQGQLIVQ